ncbi:MAG: nitronate monooxygenase [Holosporales bacterium]|jgi:NAD(P)H-dependent flavin oxidoreductase YrpB (nitropropane dioxygenase family)|nr:nitronate monooxygenase [Holosporales bacterium]
MLCLKPLVLSGAEVLPLVEGGKGISISTGATCGAWAREGAVGTFSAVNADDLTPDGQIIPQVYTGKTRIERHRELIAHAIKGGIAQAKVAHETAQGRGRIHMNVLWEMAGTEEILHGIFSRAKDLIHGITCGAGMPYKLAEIATQYGVYYYPIVSSARAFRALYKRAYHRFCTFLGGVVYEDPWRAGGHNGLSHSEDVKVPEPPYPRVVALRAVMRDCGLGAVPIIVAGGVWWLSEWADWINNPEIGPVAFQFGTRSILTHESPIAHAWYDLLLSLKKGNIKATSLSPTGFYSSAVSNAFLQELQDRSSRQIPYQEAPSEECATPFPIGVRGTVVYVSAADKILTEIWKKAGYTTPLRTPDSTLLFVTPQKAQMIRNDQAACVGCLSSCRFGGWSQSQLQQDPVRLPDPRSFCIQKTLQAVAHGKDPQNELVFSGDQAYRFAEDPYYRDGFIPSIQQLIDRIQTGF